MFVEKIPERKINRLHFYKKLDDILIGEFIPVPYALINIIFQFLILFH